MFARTNNIGWKEPRDCLVGNSKARTPNPDACLLLDVPISHDKGSQWGAGRHGLISSWPRHLVKLEISGSPGMSGHCQHNDGKHVDEGTGFTLKRKSSRLNGNLTYVSKLAYVFNVNAKWINASN